ncbi:hydrogenase maturation nickel metallochaperone HypA [Anaerocolumna sp. AGMB13020]|uniref:hydrogenase maturation nickel metallochaperone HypA/HybF n=1 Tax=Anaerocolumna sp. AGMB13020 TaxID=3081750 RepID=UPI002953B50C|nr:hydrogenase maturation nickel metallochaperone HypA [Anaerocolumna sp. AGMB13020]WOO35076.1 hydrogenase maturation nickel metallochaperone HypA [Anaerocolumna sp. AGMB13020]
MHELGVVIEVVNTVERFAQANDVSRIDSLVLQIGEMSSMVPKYIEAVYPAAIEGTILADTELIIEVLPANGLCRECKKVYHITKTKGACPLCGSKNPEILSGREFMIKEIRCV